ncbi:hypothetical protein ACTS95_07775 [Empedobacter brevis]
MKIIDIVLLYCQKQIAKEKEDGNMNISIHIIINLKMEEIIFLKIVFNFMKVKIDKRFLVKINKNEWVNRLFFTSRLYINKPIPDSIKEAPSEGWKELPVWAK